MSSKALGGRNYKYIKSHFQVSEDEVSSIVVEKQKSTIHVREFTKGDDIISERDWCPLPSTIAI